MQDVCQAALQNIIGFIVQNATNSAYLILYRSGFTCRGFFYTVDDILFMCSNEWIRSTTYRMGFQK